MMDARTGRAARMLGGLLLAGTLAGCPTPVESICSVEGPLLVCPHFTTALFPTGERREIHWQVPVGEPPADGWPAVLMFQGTAVSAALTWSASPLYPFGGYYQTQVVQRLLDAGFAVLTPETHLQGLTFWDTNNPLVEYLASGDHALILAILDEMELGTFGDIDTDALFATGISSGGYMTSRMAVSYPGRFRALAIQSGSYATCAGPLCVGPPRPADHPPTLFLHGTLDLIVPAGTMYPYEAMLADMGVPTKLVLDTTEGHAWIPAAPAEVLDWFTAYLPADAAAGLAAREAAPVEP